MTFPLNYYNTYSADITLETPQGEQVYHTQFNAPEEFDKFIRDYGCSRDPWGILNSAVIPVRTNFKDFYKDLFLPTVINRALAVNGIVKKSFALLFSLALDVLFFPVRVITFIPRAIYNALQTDHPLYEFLTKQQGISEKLIGNGLLILKCREEASLAGDSSIEEGIEVIEKPNPDQGGILLQFGTEKTLDLHKSKQEKFIDFYSFKYFCDPNWNRKTQKIIPTHCAFMGNETSKIVHTETVERDLRWRVIPHFSWKLKANIAEMIYRKVSENHWVKHKENSYPIEELVYREE